MEPVNLATDLNVYAICGKMSQRVYCLWLDISMFNFGDIRDDKKKDSLLEGDVYRKMEPRKLGPRKMRGIALMFIRINLFCFS